MAVRQLKRFPQEPQDPPKTPPCESMVADTTEHGRAWRKMKNAGTPRGELQCCRDAVVELDGKNLCRIHAGFVALDMYLAGRLVKCGS
jgi:hypothetical protein